MGFYRLGIGGALAAMAALSGGCQLVSGLADLDARDAAGPGSGGAGGEGVGAGGAGGSAGGAGGAAGGAGGGTGGAGGMMPAAGCELPPNECPIVLVSDAQVDVQMLAIDSQSIYWATQGEPFPPTGQIWRANLDGTVPMLLGLEVNPHDLVVDEPEGLIFWADNRDISSGTIRYGSNKAVNMSGTATTSSMFPINLLTIGTLSAALFYTSVANQSINRVPSETKPLTAVNIYTMLQGFPQNIVVEDESLYWPETVQVRRMSDAGAGMPMVDGLFTLESGSLRGIDVENGLVYAATVANDTGGIVVWSQSPDKPTSLATDPSPKHVLADGVNVYWTSDSSPECSDGKGYVRRKSLISGDPHVTLAGSLPCPTELVKDENFVYWGAGKSIYRVSRSP